MMLKTGVSYAVLSCIYKFQLNVSRYNYLNLN